MFFFKYKNTEQTRFKCNSTFHLKHCSLWAVIISQHMLLPTYLLPNVGWGWSAYKHEQSTVASPLFGGLENISKVSIGSGKNFTR